MILCVSANPGLDRRVRLPHFKVGEVQRAQAVDSLPGGKAAHVALAAHALGVRTAWIGFLGGGIGGQVATELGQLGIEVVPVRTQSPTRVNLEVIENTGRITELLEPGGQVSLAERNAMLEGITELLQGTMRGALVVASGSLPPGVPSDFYSSIIAKAKEAGSKLFLDASGDGLSAGLGAAPDLVKPNCSEAKAVLKSSIATPEDAARAARQLINRGPRSCAITLGARGMVWVEEYSAHSWFAEPPQVQAISTVGCGDATLAGFAYANLQSWHGERALRFATACGAANCLANRTGEISSEIVERLATEVRVREIEAF